jgi:3-hydroxyacyl-CoA dehydrogenase
MARVSKSAQEAQELLFLAPTDGISMNKARLLSDAKAKALALRPGYTPSAPYHYHLPGKTAYILLAMTTQAYQLLGKATAYDVTIAKQLATALSGGSCDMTDVLTEDDLLDLELQAFMTLVKQPETMARLEHLLTTGKPLRN